MLRSPGVRIALGVIVAIAALAILRFKPWERREVASGPNRTRQELEVAYLPVT